MRLYKDVGGKYVKHKIIIAARSLHHMANLGEFKARQYGNG